MTKSDEELAKGLRLIAEHFAIANENQRTFGVRGWPNMKTATSEALSQCAALAADRLEGRGGGEAKQSYCVRQGENGEWGIFSTTFNVRVATFARNSASARDVISAALSREGEGWRELLEEARDLLMERRYGNPARSPAHNARLIIDKLLAPAPPLQEG